MPIDSTGNAFSERRKTLEDAFFKDRDRQLVEKMRHELESMEETKKLAHVTGIAEERVLQSLVQAGVRAETLAAVGLIPMVEVAWCDGSVSAEERDAVLNAAASQNISPGTAAYELLGQWLITRPDAQVIASWKEYVSEIAKLMPKESVAEVRKHMLERCKRVAESAGGFLGLATISKSEQAKIDEFAKVWG